MSRLRLIVRVASLYLLQSLFLFFEFQFLSQMQFLIWIESQSESALSSSSIIEIDALNPFIKFNMKLFCPKITCLSLALLVVILALIFSGYKRVGDLKSALVLSSIYSTLSRDQSLKLTVLKGINYIGLASQYLPIDDAGLIQLSQLKCYSNDRVPLTVDSSLNYLIAAQELAEMFSYYSGDSIVPVLKAGLSSAICDIISLYGLSDLQKQSSKIQTSIKTRLNKTVPFMRLQNIIVRINGISYPQELTAYKTQSMDLNFKLDSINQQINQNILNANLYINRVAGPQRLQYVSSINPDLFLGWTPSNSQSSFYKILSSFQNISKLATPFQGLDFRNP